jgi:hypothetical protein
MVKFYPAFILTFALFAPLAVKSIEFAAKKEYLTTDCPD